MQSHSAAGLAILQKFSIENILSQTNNNATNILSEEDIIDDDIDTSNDETDEMDVQLHDNAHNVTDPSSSSSASQPVASS